MEVVQILYHGWAALQHGLGKALVVGGVSLGELGHGQENGEDVVDVVFCVPELIRQGIEIGCGCGAAFSFHKSSGFGLCRI